MLASKALNFTLAKGCQHEGTVQARITSHARRCAHPLLTTMTSYGLTQSAIEASSRGVVCQSAVTEREETSTSSTGLDAPPMRIIIAGGGIGGLVLAVGLIKSGFDVVILERDLTAIRGEGKYRGPIQVQSNALAALEALDTDVAEQVLAVGCITGDRINGLCDGVTGEWYCKFDTFHPAVDRGLPVTRVISRHTLQEILADKVRQLGGDNVIINDVHVVDYKEETDKETGARKTIAIAEDGRTWTGDMLVGADGIYSKIRRKMVGHSDPTYAEYTCYTGISDFTPPDIDTVGYRVFLGNRQYFVSSDVGGGKMQWYAFHKEEAGGTDQEGQRKKRLMEIFGHWSPMVTDLIDATPEDDVLRRDIYDRPPIFKWNDGRVVLLGDSAHAMQPNLGQGGGMAIEDAFQLVVDLTKEEKDARISNRSPDIDGVLSGYFQKRVLRAGAIHGMARMAAIMASTYKAYLGEGLGPLEWMTQFKIPHPGRVSGQIVLKATMPGVLEWVLGGYQTSLEDAGRLGACRLEDQPTGFSESDFPLFMRDDDALLRAAHADWVIQRPSRGIREDAMDISKAEGPLVIGRGEGCDLCLDAESVSQQHARVEQVGDDYFITDLEGSSGTYVNGKQISPGVAVRIHPSDELRFGSASGDDENVLVVKLRHESLSAGGHGQYNRRGAAALESSTSREMALHE